MSKTEVGWLKLVGLFEIVVSARLGRNKHAGDFGPVEIALKMEEGLKIGIKNNYQVNFGTVGK